MTTTRRVLVLVTVAGLAVDAYVHLSLAGRYDAVRATVSQGELFRAEGIAAILAALLLLVRPGRVTAAIAALVAGGGLAALLLYRYVDVGQLGPFPNMYEPLWYAKKTWSMVGEAVATVAALMLVVLGPGTATTVARARPWTRRSAVSR